MGTGRANGAEVVGTVASLRGIVTIQRGTGEFPAKPKLGLLTHDSVFTGADSRVKLDFIDGSILTLGELSKLSVDEFIHSKMERGKSLFNLIDGKLRAVVGKTRFEVQTPTAVAAARGTEILFAVGRANNRPFAKIICLAGVVAVRSASPAIPGETMLPAGSMVIVNEGEPVPKPQPVPAGELSGPLGDLAGEGGSHGPSSVTGNVINISNNQGATNIAVGAGNMANMGSVVIEGSTVQGTVTNTANNQNAVNVAIGTGNEANTGTIVIK
jgi:hypothetical protein